MSEKTVPTFCNCCSQILQVISESNPETNKPVQQDEGKSRNVFGQREIAG